MLAASVAAKRPSNEGGNIYRVTQDKQHVLGSHDIGGGERHTYRYELARLARVKLEILARRGKKERPFPFVVHVWSARMTPLRQHDAKKLFG